MSSDFNAIIHICFLGMSYAYIVFQVIDLNGLRNILPALNNFYVENI